MMLTQRQYDRLPDLAREIVDVERQIEALCCADVPAFQSYVALKGRCKELAAAAHKIWGHRIEGGRASV